MTTEQKIIRAKVGLLELAKQLGNVELLHIQPLAFSSKWDEGPTQAPRRGPRPLRQHPHRHQHPCEQLLFCASVTRLTHLCRFRP